MDINSLNFTLTAAIERHVEDRVSLAVEAAATSVRGIMVRLRDINGVRGGVDMACRIVVWLQDRGTVVVEALDRDLYAAIDRAAARLKEAVTRRVKRRRTLHREYAQRRARRVPA